MVTPHRQILWIAGWQYVASEDDVHRGFYGHFDYPPCNVDMKTTSSLFSKT